VTGNLSYKAVAYRVADSNMIPDKLFVSQKCHLQYCFHTCTHTHTHEQRVERCNGVCPCTHYTTHNCMQDSDIGQKLSSDR